MYDLEVGDCLQAVTEQRVYSKKHSVYTVDAGEPLVVSSIEKYDSGVVAYVLLHIRGGKTYRRMDYIVDHFVAIDWED